MTSNLPVLTEQARRRLDMRTIWIISSAHIQEDHMSGRGNLGLDRWRLVSSGECQSNFYVGEEADVIAEAEGIPAYLKTIFQMAIKLKVCEVRFDASGEIVNFLPSCVMSGQGNGFLSAHFDPKRVIAIYEAGTENEFKVFACGASIGLEPTEDVLVEMFDGSQVSYGVISTLREELELENFEDFEDAQQYVLNFVNGFADHPNT